MTMHCRVMFTINVNKSTGATNSACGTVVDVKLGTPPPHWDASRGDWVRCLWVKLDSGATVRVSRTCMREAHFQGHTFVQHMFPLILAYAMTAHRCQGATLTGTTILHVKDTFAPAILYVMLSRATSRDKLYILDGLRPDDFVPAILN